MKANSFYAIIIFSVLNALLFTRLCQGHSHTFVKKVERKSVEPDTLIRSIGIPDTGVGAQRTFANEDDEKDDDKWWRISNKDSLDYGLTSLVIWPVLLLIFGILVIPTTLVIVVAFVIPVITDEVEGKAAGRFLSTSSINNMWMPIYLTQEVLKAYESECIERVSCELTKTAHQNGYTLTNWLHRQLRNSTALSYNLQSRLSRSIAQASQKDSKCSVFQCSPLGSPPAKDRVSSRRFDFSEMFEPEYIWDWFVKYWGGRYIFVRKLAANKDVEFFPYRKG